LPIIEHTAAPRARSGTINAAVAYSGIGRSSLYILAVKHPGLFRKLGDRTLVDFNLLDRIIDDLPSAEINVPSLMKSAQPQQPQPARTRRRKRAKPQ
jgi:hypothetical protein